MYVCVRTLSRVQSRRVTLRSVGSMYPDFKDWAHCSAFFCLKMSPFGSQMKAGIGPVEPWYFKRSAMDCARVWYSGFAPRSVRSPMSEVRLNRHHGLHTSSVMVPFTPLARAWSVPGSRTPEVRPKGTGHCGVGDGEGGAGGGAGALALFARGPQT